jgi:flagellar biosynthesis/type III secretory pathway protein FliH
MLAIWIRATLMEKPNYGILLNEVNDLDEVRVMLSDKLEEWAKEYIAEGRQEGRQEGEILALQKLLAKRFGAIPFDITAQIANASLDQIEHWFDKAIDADTLSDVFQ